jgi:LacI family transcriptional regulator
MPGIVDVARKAGVSITTASRVLNNVDYPVAAATRRRVEAAARELRYSPSALARALVTRRSGIVGVLVGDMVDPYFAEIARGVEDTARRAGYLVAVCNTDRDPQTERRYVTTLSDYHVDALIFIGGDIVSPPVQRKLKQQLTLAARRGTLAVACAGEHAGLPTIDIDHRAAARDMTRYLINLGHRRIGFIGGPRDISTSGQREAGFRAALAEVDLQPGVQVDADFTYAGGLQAARRILVDHAPTAIFAANDQMALAALNAARALGLSVPAQVTVVGFGDTGAAVHAAPALTTVSMPRHQLGQSAMQSLLTAMAAKTTRIQACRLPYRIVLRESSAPPCADTLGEEERIA